MLDRHTLLLTVQNGMRDAGYREPETLISSQPPIQTIGITNGTLFLLLFSCEIAVVHYDSSFILVKGKDFASCEMRPRNPTVRDQTVPGTCCYNDYFSIIRIPSTLLL